MYNGIAILGLNGSGKSTLSHAPAEDPGYCEMDADSLAELPCPVALLNGTQPISGIFRQILDQFI